MLTEYIYSASTLISSAQMLLISDRLVGSLLVFPRWDY